MARLGQHCPTHSNSYEGMDGSIPTPENERCMRMPTLVRNLERGPAVFSDPPSNIAMEWQGRGDPNGLDVQPVPDALIENVNFLKAIQAGVFEVVEATDPAVKEKLEAQMQAHQRRREIAAANTEAVLDRESERVIANVSVDEKGLRTPIPQAVVGESENEAERDSDGKLPEKPIQVVMGPREQG